MSEEEIKRQLSNIRCRELAITRSIMKCSNCKGITVENTDHPVLLRKLYHDKGTYTAKQEGRYSEICPHHERMIDRFNRECASD